MYGGARQGMDQQTPDPFGGGMRGFPGMGAGPPGWPPPDGNMNKPLPAQFPGMTAPVQPPMDKGPRSLTGGGLQSGPPADSSTMGFGGTAGPPGMGGAMPPWLQSIGALLAQRRGMMGNDPWGQGGGASMGSPGMGSGEFGPGVGQSGANVMGTGAPPVPGVPPKPPGPVAATPPPTVQRMSQGRPVTERGGVTGVTGRRGGFQKLGKSAMRRLK